MRIAEDDAARTTDTEDGRLRIADMERELRLADTQLSWDQAVRDLHTNEGWKRLAQRMARDRLKELELCATRRMDAYELGEVQGRLAMMNIFSQIQPMPPEQLAEFRAYAEDLKARLDNERNKNR